jgi:hypothetical protein
MAPIELAAMPMTIGTPIQGQRSGRCLDWSNIIVKSVTCNQAPKQQWTYNTVHEIKSSDNRCLDMGGEKVHIWNCDLAEGDVRKNQNWVYDLVSHQIKHLSEPDLCLQDGSGPGEVTMKPCSQDVQDQKWLLKISSTLDSPSDSGQGQSSDVAENLAGAPFKIQSQEGSLCLDDASQLRTCSGALPGQQWTLESGPGHLRSRDGHCLAADKIIIPQVCSDSPHQEWIFNNNGLIQAKSGTCLAAPVGASNGSTATMMACDESSNVQKWRVTPMGGAIWSHGALSCVTQLLLAIATFWYLV